ncbi:DUF4209 domain-containing protein [Micromonospora tulbaghiae]|uniref:DUF4209 domain-containing protein n=1 Tax=Micromonospora tulbaghiae TaxID=479978 RepID=UPI0033FF3857
MTDDVASVTSVIDSVDAQRVHDVEWQLRSKLPSPGPYLDEETPPPAINLELAAAWAFSYKVRIDQSSGRPRIVFVPYFEAPDGEAYPPHVRSVPSSVVDMWEILASHVSTPYARARLEHLLFEARRGNGKDRAKAAALAYIGAAEQWDTGHDKIESLSISARLARAVGARELSRTALREVERLAREGIESEPAVFGVAIKALRVLCEEPSYEGQVDELLTHALDRFDDVWQQDQVIQLQISRADAKGRAALARRRVELWINAARDADPLIRAGYLKKALQIADRASESDLTERAAAALQGLRSESLGMMSISASTAMSEADMREIISPIADTATWQEGLAAFSRFGPLTGRAEDTREAVAEQREKFVFASLMPSEIFGADNLPRFFGGSEEQRQEIALAQHETFALQAWSPLISRALHGIAEKHGIPSEEDLASFFADLPMVEPNFGKALARTFIRYWLGDYEGAAYAAAARLEAIARHLVLALDAGVYRLQRQSKPGQYPGLGALLQTLKEKGLDESWYRFILTLCANPAGGWNLRNDLMHGFINNLGAPAAAFLLQAVLFLATLQPTPPAKPDEEVA